MDRKLIDALTQGGGFNVEQQLRGERNPDASHKCRVWFGNDVSLETSKIRRPSH